MRSSKLCYNKTCDKTASFNVVGGKPLYCSEHKLDNMINVKHKKCLECNKIPYFNYINEKTGIYCADHAKKNMVNIKSKVCEFLNCPTLASYNVIESKTPKFCSIHKQDNMYHVTHRCNENNCGKHPIFNFINKKTGLYCVDHKKKDMVDVNHKKCEKCLKTALFNFVNESAKYCGDHKEKDMIDVISKTCQFINCKTKPVYNYSNKTNGIYCNSHKLENMVDVKSLRCNFKDCYKRPLYNNIGIKNGLYCRDHKEDGMIDVCNLRCKLCDIFIQNRTKYEHHCVNCYIHLYPDNKISKNFRTKERAVADYIRENFKEIDWFFDKKVDDGCSKRRPDIMCDLGKHILIVEIDEFQHKRYEYICENKRYMEISKDFGHRSIIFIRFNPDKYILDNKTISSCWKEDKKGHLMISKIEEWNNRLESLKININIWTHKSTEKTLEIINLFFDQ
jgi:hypothetical protein